MPDYSEETSGKRDAELSYKNPLREEDHPELSLDFPYKHIVREFDARETGAPWHWHRELELFFIEEGTLEYRTPDQTIPFQKGSGGLVNASVLHRTNLKKDCRYVRQKLHIFAPEFLGGKETGIYQRYTDVVMKSHRSVFVFQEKENELAEELEKLDRKKPGYEIRLRNVLSEILLSCYLKLGEQEERLDPYETDEKMLGMMAFVEDHMQEKLSVKEIAASVYVSERDCYRKFQKALGETPLQFVQSVRLERACQLLGSTKLPIGEIAERCGLGAGSYFIAVFARKMGCTPGEYRRQQKKEEWKDDRK